jgi:hypothetical protein
MTFSWKPPETKKFAEIFCEVFNLNKKKYFVEPSRTYVRLKKDLLIHKQ